MTTPDEEWFSEKALRKQDEILRRYNMGLHIPDELTFGMLEPRVPPAPEQCCTHCGSDARDEVGGEVREGKRWCDLCIMRSHHLDDRDIVTFEGDTCPGCGGPVEENYFDRSVCPEPCSTMHTRCKRCGIAVNGCIHETGRLRRA